MNYLTIACYAGMVHMTELDKRMLTNAIALRAGTATQLMQDYGMTRKQLKKFADEHMAEIRIVASDEEATPVEPLAGEVTPTQLDDLWITKKFERLRRLQDFADTLYKDGPLDAMSAREFRSYLMLAATELGQLLNRGAGDSGSGDSLSVDITGVNMEALQ